MAAKFEYMTSGWGSELRPATRRGSLLRPRRVVADIAEKEAGRSWRVREEMRRCEWSPIKVISGPIYSKCPVHLALYLFMLDLSYYIHWLTKKFKTFLLMWLAEIYKLKKMKHGFYFWGGLLNVMGNMPSGDAKWKTKQNQWLLYPIWSKQCTSLALSTNESNVAPYECVFYCDNVILVHCYGLIYTVYVLLSHCNNQFFNFNCDMSCLLFNIPC